MFVVAIVSVGGGVGRTTLAANLASIARKRGRPVLAVDWDPGNRLGLHLGTCGLPEQGWVAESIRGGAWHEAACRNSDGVDFLPFGRLGWQARTGFEQCLAQDDGWLAKRLKSIALPEETLVLVDAAAGLSVYCRQALAAADGVLALLAPSPAAGFDVETLDQACQELPFKQPPLKYLLNQVDASHPLSADMAVVLRSNLKSHLLRYTLHRDEAVSEALASNLPVADYAPDSQANHDLQGITSWLLAAAAGDW